MAEAGGYCSKAEKLNHGLDHGVISAGCAEDLGSRESRANKVETKGNSQVCRLGNRPDRGGVCSEKMGSRPTEEADVSVGSYRRQSEQHEIRERPDKAGHYDIMVLHTWVIVRACRGILWGVHGD